jgi:hypothetical protein
MHFLLKSIYNLSTWSKLSNSSINILELCNLWHFSFWICYMSKILIIVKSESLHAPSTSSVSSRGNDIFSTQSISFVTMPNSNVLSCCERVWRHWKYLQAS